MKYRSIGRSRRTAKHIENQADESTALPLGQVTTRIKNPAAVALGTLGGKKGGPARARKLTKRRRRDIARLAARARWKRQKKTPS